MFSAAKIPPNSEEAWNPKQRVSPSQSFARKLPVHREKAIPGLFRAGGKAIVALATSEPATKLQSVQQVCIERPWQWVDENLQQTPLAIR